MDESSLYKDIWLAAILGTRSSLRRMARRHLERVQVSCACEWITQRIEVTTLRISAHLLYGTTLIHDQQCEKIYADAHQLSLNIKDALLCKTLSTYPYTTIERARFDTITISMPTFPFFLLASYNHIYQPQWCFMASQSTFTKTTTMYSNQESSRQLTIGETSAQNMTFIELLNPVESPERHRQITLGDDPIWLVSNQDQDYLSLPINYPETPQVLLGEDGELHDVTKISPITQPMMTSWLQQELSMPRVDTGHQQLIIDELADVEDNPLNQMDILPIDPSYNSVHLSDITEMQVDQSLLPPAIVEVPQTRRRRHRRQSRNWQSWIDNDIELNSNELSTFYNPSLSLNVPTIKGQRKQKSSISPWILTPAIPLYADELRVMWEMNTQTRVIHDRPLSSTHSPVQNVLPSGLMPNLDPNEIETNLPDEPEQMRGHEEAGAIENVLAFPPRMPWDPQDTSYPYTATDRPRRPTTVGAWTTPSMMTSGKRQYGLSGLSWPASGETSLSGTRGQRPSMPAQQVHLSGGNSGYPPRSGSISRHMHLIDNDEESPHLFPDEEQVWFKTPRLLHQQDTENFYRQV
ncbi:hypothetical protein BDF19DRAFT_419325 [Syncephalis fuscata]|nr:hypothetical protein BDF19DRAFT_419325 [Syncephalis fuscata]